MTAFRCQWIFRKGTGLGKRNPLPGNEKGTGQSRDYKQIVQYHTDPLG